MSDTSVQTAPSAPAAAAAAVTADPPVPAAPRKKDRSPALQVIEVLASLKLTVVLFALSLVLVFYGTLAQIDSGIWTIVRDYFRSFFVWIPFQLTVQFLQKFFPWSVPSDPAFRLPGAFPFPGGWTIGGLLLVNVLAAHAIRF